MSEISLPTSNARSPSAQSAPLAEMTLETIPAVGPEGNAAVEQELDPAVSLGAGMGEHEAGDLVVGDQLAIGVELVARVGRHMQQMAADLGGSAGHAPEHLEDDRVLVLEVVQG